MEDSKLDKVIKALELCKQGFHCPSECPYLMDCNDLTKPMFVDLAKDALELLKEYIWMPCSVKMPCEKDGRVLVSMPNGEVRTAKYSEYGNGQWFIGDMMGVGGEIPVAWMPMPKPYKGN